jgi:hypothetical protein
VYGIKCINVKNIFVTDGTRITSKQNPFFDLYGDDSYSSRLCNSAT